MANTSGQYTIQECVHRSENSALFRAVDDRTGEAVILKTVNAETMSPAELAKLRKEYAILSKLKSKYVPEAIDLIKIEDHFFLVLKYSIGVSLAEYMKAHTITVKEFLFLARAIVTGVLDIHRAGIIHKDLNPSNIIYSPQLRRITIIDFGIAAEFSFESPVSTDPTVFKGTLAYTSPEQTGRLNRAIDFRTDFYSLGVAFFEMLCGRRPFTSDSPAELIYDHVARVAPLVSAVNPEVPEMLSRIIAKLMSKMPEERYHSAEGLLFDLNRCLTAYDVGREIPGFELGRGDCSDRIDVPQKLYGREKEVALLKNAYRETLNGGKCTVFIGGPSGSGKTTLAGELRSLVLQNNGILLCGKYDQYQRNIPHYALFQLLRNLCDVILAESEDRIDAWKERLSKALGEDAALLVDKVPRLTLITGEPQPLPELSPLEASVRFRAAAQRLIAAVASPQRPLVLFLDDVHYIGSGETELLEESVDNGETGSLMIVACYRDNEVDGGHPLILCMNKMASRGVDLRRISLAGLDEASVSKLLADTLLCGGTDIDELARLVCGKTHGNPFYIKQFLKLSHTRGLIRFDRAGRAWVWDLESMRASPAEENVVDFLIRNMDQLSSEAVELLSLGACGGRSFSIDLLSRLSGKEAEEVAAILRPAVSLEIIYPLQSDGKKTSLARFQFTHDRFQQAFYTVLPARRRQGIHYALAKWFADPANQQGERVGIQFVIADHYSKSLDAAPTAREKRRVAEILLSAAHAASLLSSFDMALRYLEQIIAAMGELGPADNAFTFKVYAAYHLALCGLPRYGEADEAYRLLQSLAPSPIDLADSSGLQAVGLSNRGKYKEAFYLAVGLLERLGVPFRKEVTLDDGIYDEIAACYAELEKRKFSEGSGVMETTDRNEVGIQKLLNRLITIVLFFNPAYSSWVILTNAQRILAHGYTPAGLHLYASVSSALVPLRNDYRMAYTAAREGMRLAEKSAYKNETFCIYHTFSLVDCHWFEDVKNSIPYARESLAGNHAVGDFEFACYSYFTTQQAVLETCQRLGELAAESEAAQSYAAKMENQHALGSYLSYAQLYKALKGATRTPGSFEDDAFSEALHLENVRGDPMAQCYYYILRGLSAAIYLDYDTAFELTEKAVPLLSTLTGFYLLALHNFLHSLSVCKRLENHDCGAEERRRLWGTLEANQKWLGERAADSPANFLHLHSVIDAEITALRGTAAELVARYEQAMEQAATAGRPYHYAMICELAAMRFLKRKAPATAGNFLREAYSAYLAWEAEGKVEQLRRNSTSLLTVRHAARRGAVGTLSMSGNGMTQSAIDFNALITASQTISGEMELTAILDKLISILQEVSGAQDIYYLTQDGEGGYLIRAEGHCENGRHLAEELPARADRVSLGVVHYVVRTGETIVLDNASTSNVFEQDEHIAAFGSRSVLCMPVINKGDLKGVLYLENRLVDGAFDKGRLEALTIIASQLAISLENAYLYGNLQFLVDDKTKELREEIRVRKAAEKRLEQMANHDTLTGLPNRRMFQSHLEQSIKAAEYEKAAIAVLFIDLDGFKLINDRYGHDKGDAALVAIADRLASTVRSCDMISRLGGDEFVLVVENVKSREIIETLCSRIIDTVRRPIELSPSGITVALTASIGVSLLGQDGTTAEALITNSDRAMYEAKRRGKDQHAFYQSE